MLSTVPEIDDGDITVTGKKKQRYKEKKCAFPGCGDIFIGRGKAKYCEEHRLAKYRKILYKKNDNDGESNTIINHDEISFTKSIRICDLDGCECEYTITLSPKITEYPKYCINHRNAYKRERFIIDNKNN